MLLTSSVALCCFALFLCLGGSGSTDIAGTEKAPNSVIAQNNQGEQSTGSLSNDTGFTGSSFFDGTELFYKTMLAVVLVAILGGAAIFMTKRFLPKIANLQGREIRIIETVHLGPRKSVHLIEIGPRRLLIGSTNENIRKLADLTEFSTDIPIREDELD